MKRCVVILVLILQTAYLISQSSGESDPYKATLDRLQSLSSQREPEWRFHTDVPHPEDPGLSDADWGSLTVKNLSEPGGINGDEEHWTGTHVFRRWVEIPERINGYPTKGSRVLMDIRFGSPGALMITVFSNGGILYRGNDDDILPVLLTPNEMFAKSSSERAYPRPRTMYSVPPNSSNPPPVSLFPPRTASTTWRMDSP